MKIITDATANITPEQARQLGVEVVPFQVTFNGQTYRDGIDITPADLYSLYLQYPQEYPSTSQPLVGDFLSVFKQYGDEEVLAVTVSSGLSGSYNSALQASKMMPAQNVTVVDSLMVGPALGWMVAEAVRCARLGWSKEKIIEAMLRIRASTITMVAFTDMKYLIHSGRVSHLKSMVTSLLHIKPIIGMNPVDGKYTSAGMEMTAGRVARKMAHIVQERFGSQKLRLQLMHGSNLPGVELLRKASQELLDAVEDDLTCVTLVLGALAGPTVFGLAAAPLSLFETN